MYVNTISIYYSMRKASEIPQASGNVSVAYLCILCIRIFDIFTRLIVIRIDRLLCLSWCALLQYRDHCGELQGAYHAVPVEHR